MSIPSLSSHLIASASCYRHDYLVMDRRSTATLIRPYVIFYSGIVGADLGFCRLAGPGGDLRSWVRWLRCVEAERDGRAEQVEYAALFRGRC